MNQFNITPRGLASGLRLFLKSVQNVNGPRITDGVNSAERIAAVIAKYLHHASPAKATQRFGLVVLTATLRDVERVTDYFSDRAGELGQILAARPHPHDWFRRNALDHYYSDFTIPMFVVATLLQVTVFTRSKPLVDLKIHGCTPTEPARCRTPFAMKLIVAGCLFVLLLAGLSVSEFRRVRTDLRARFGAIEAAWQQLDKDVQRRAELVPHLSEAVARFVPRDPAVTGKLSEARGILLADHTPEAKITAYNELNAAVGSLLAAAERTPQLRRRRDFLALQYELESTENRIAQSRSLYNDAVQKYNIKLALFPANLVASVSGYRPWTAYFRTPVSKEAH